MNEGKTSALFAAVAAVCFGLAWWSRPDAITNENDLKTEVTGQPVFAKFEDPSEATSFQIVNYDDSLGQLERFEVAKDKTSNMWKLPSYEDYPADAAEQVRDATTPLISMPILSVASLDRGDHALYGVVNPDDDKMSVGESGVGKLVRVKGEANQVLAELVIGKPVDGAEGQHYVRVPTEDATYIVELNTAPFTTDFKKWINQQLLEVRSFDISTVGLRDYVILPTQDGYGMSRNFDADLSFDSAKNAWSLERFITYDKGKPVETELTADEKLQDKPLNDLRNAVQDLEIVSVRRKPKGLAADLKADKSLMENKESLQSLVSQGFIPQEGLNGTEIFATGGETLVGTAAGVKYLLRFGEAVTDLSGAVEAEDDASSGLRRYLLVSAVLDESKFPVPDLEPLPETVADMQARKEAQAKAAAPQQPPTTEPTAEAPTAEAAPAEQPPAPETQGATDAPAAQTAEPSGGAATESPADNADDKADNKAETPAEQPTDAPAIETPAEETPAEETPTEETPATDGNKSSSLQTTGRHKLILPVAFQSDEATPAAAADDDQGAEANAEAPATDSAQPAAEEPAAEEPAAEEPAAQTPAKSDEELKEELEFVREQIAKDNQRKIDARNEKMDAARRRVQELNARFADWYYVVSDEVYKKLKVSRDQLIGPNTPDAESATPAAPSPGIPGLPPGFNLQP